jgi:hypothetical protein
MPPYPVYVKDRLETCHAHAWVDPDDPPMQRALYSPVIGTKRREMKEGKTYQCQNCSRTLTIPLSKQQAKL